MPCFLASEFIALVQPLSWKEELGLVGFCILIPKLELPDVFSQTLSSGMAQMVCFGLNLSRQVIARPLDQIKETSEREF